MISNYNRSVLNTLYHNYKRVSTDGFALKGGDEIMNNELLPHIFKCHSIIKGDIVRGKGAYFFDEAGKRYIDFESGIWAAVLGHNNQRINKVITQQINKITHQHTGMVSHIAEELAERLLKLFQWKDGKAVFLSSGSEAVELSITIAKLVTEKQTVLSFANSYLSAYGTSGNFMKNKEWIKIDFFKCKNCKKSECISSCGQLEEIDFNSISAFVLESGNTSGRVIFPPEKLVKYLEKEIKKSGGLMVVNEITTGIGRTGKWFGHNHYNINPDIVALGKGLGNGYPISAVLMDKKIATKAEDKNFLYAQSHQNDPLGCAVAKEVINILEEENLIDKSNVLAEIFINELRRIKENNSIVKAVRGRGLMIAMELHKEDIVTKIFKEMMKRGYFIGITPSANALRFYPPLIVEEKDIINMCLELELVLREYSS